MSFPLNIIIVQKTGVLKLLSIKDFKEEELYKKCGFKKAEDFQLQHKWKLKMNGEKYQIFIYAKSDGRANSENKYDFPPPIDTKLFFGDCCLVCKKVNNEGILSFANLSIDLWNNMYEKLFGGFEDLATTAKEDEEEEDELDNIPDELKTKQGYLKDGFVVDSSDYTDSDENDSNDNFDIETNSDETETETETENELNKKTIITKSKIEQEFILTDIGSELSEEEYDYDEDDV
jgi:hypothetical protein